MGPGVSRRVPARMGASVLPPMVPACVDLGGQDCSVNQVILFLWFLLVPAKKLLKVIKIQITQAVLASALCGGWDIGVSPNIRTLHLEHFPRSMWWGLGL